MRKYLMLAHVISILGVSGGGSVLVAQTSPSETNATSTSPNLQERKGFWINVGFGAGSLGCNDCTSRETGLSGQLALGGMFNPRFGVGVSSNGWTKQQDGVTLSMGSLAALAKFYPSATGGFYLSGGLGLGSLDLGISGYGKTHSTGSAAILGLGYDVRIGKSVSLTPFINGVGMSFDAGDANFSQIGIGFTWH